MAHPHPGPSAPPQPGRPALGARPGPYRRLALGLTALLSLSACGWVGCEPKRPIVDVRFDRAPGEQFAFKDDALHRPTRALMDALPGFDFRPARPQERGWALVVLLALGQTATGDDPGAVGVRLELSALGPVTAGPDHFTGAALRRGPGPQLALAEQALDGAGEALQDAIQLATAPAPTVVQAIRARQGEAQLRAIQAAGQRRLRAATEPLTELLARPQLPESTLLKVVGALAQLRDPRATEALITTARGRSRPYLIQLIFALAQIGGAQAEGYLFTLASGHPDPVVKTTAQEALTELERPRPETTTDEDPAPTAARRDPRRQPPGARSR